MSLNNTLNKKATPQTSPKSASPETVNPQTETKLINLDKVDDNEEQNSIPISVTHFSPATNGFGVEKETLFSDTNPFKNPFLTTNGTSESKKFATIGRSNPFSSKNNPFLEEENEKTNGVIENGNADLNGKADSETKNVNGKHNEENGIENNENDNKLNKIVSNGWTKL